MADGKPVETINRHGRRVLDVSGLPDKAMDSYAPVWWGNALLIMIESMTIVLLLGSYFYLRRNFSQWPPTQPNWVPDPLFNARPDLPIPTAELILIVLSCLPMYWTDMAARRNDERRVKLGLWLMVAIAVAMVAMRFFEMQASHIKFRWDENAYGSIVWMILGMHLTYLLGAAAEFFIMVFWVTRHQFDPKHGLDVTLLGGYWYWAAATWVACYATVYIGARVL